MEVCEADDKRERAQVPRRRYVEVQNKDGVSHTFTRFRTIRYDWRNILRLASLISLRMKCSTKETTFTLFSESAVSCVSCR